jgi:hypothetical protein
MSSVCTKERTLELLLRFANQVYSSVQWGAVLVGKNVECWLGSQSRHSLSTLIERSPVGDTTQHDSNRSSRTVTLYFAAVLNVKEMNSLIEY